MDTIKPTTLRSPLTQFQHDFYLNKICEKIRKELIATYPDTPTDSMVEQIIGLYEIIAPKMCSLLKESRITTRRQHLRAVLQAPLVVYIHLDDPFVDFKRLAEYADTIWPAAKIQEFIDDQRNPKYFTQDGKEVCTAPGFSMFLEKVGPDYSDVSSTKFNRVGLGHPRPDQPINIDLSRPVQDSYVVDSRHDPLHSLKQFWNTMKDGVVVPMSPEWAMDYSLFEKWALDNGFKHGMAILRKDPNGWYTPENCQVVPRQQPDRSTPPRGRDQW